MDKLVLKRSALRSLIREMLDNELPVEPNASAQTDLKQEAPPEDGEISPEETDPAKIEGNAL